MTVLYQRRGKKKKNPERNKDRFCGEQSRCGNRLLIGRRRAPRAYKSRCEWLKGLAEQLEPRVCSCSASLSSSFHVSRPRKHPRGAHVQVTSEVASAKGGGLHFLLGASEGVEVTPLSCLQSLHIFPLSFFLYLFIRT